jgi:AcrR family transcriptional regulator
MSPAVHSQPPRTSAVRRPDPTGAEAAQARDADSPTMVVLTPAGRRILTAAAELFYTRGIHAVGVEAIAAAAGVTKKTLYDRFGSKEGLVAAYLEDRSERWQRWLARHLDEATPEQRLLAPFDALDAWLRREPRRGCAFVNAAAELPSAGEQGRRVADREKRAMRTLFTRLAAEAGEPEPETLGAQLYMLHEGATVAYALTGDDAAVATARAAAARLATGA